MVRQSIKNKDSYGNWNETNQSLYEWDEEQKLRSVQNADGIHAYLYDYNGERLAKTSLLGADVEIDRVGGYTGSLSLLEYTTYVNPEFIVTPYQDWNNYSRNFFMNGIRVASEVGGYPCSGSSLDPDPEPPGPIGGEGLKTGLTGQSAHQSFSAPEPTVEDDCEAISSVSARWELLDLLTEQFNVLDDTDPLQLSDFEALLIENPYPNGMSMAEFCDLASACLGSYYNINGVDNFDNTGNVVCMQTPVEFSEAAARCLCEVSEYWTELALDRIDCDAYRALYWYHPDYLGHVELVTDRSGFAYQYFYYAPFGDVLIEQNVVYGTFDSRWTFNGKEIDKETGLGYYGARYYDVDWSVWMSVDPLSHLSPSQTPYHFVNNNPIRLIDPDGRNAVNPDPDGKSPPELQTLELPSDPNCLPEEWVPTEPVGVPEGAGHSRYFKHKDKDLWLAYDEGKDGKRSHYHAYQGNGKGGIIQKRRFNGEGTYTLPKQKGEHQNHLYPGQKIATGRMLSQVSRTLGVAGNVFSLVALFTDSPSSPIYTFLTPGEGQQNRAYVYLINGQVYEWSFAQGLSDVRELRYYSDYDYINGQWRGIGLTHKFLVGSNGNQIQIR